VLFRSFLGKEITGHGNILAAHATSIQKIEERMKEK